jgi:hypothetical protein
MQERKSGCKRCKTPHAQEIFHNAIQDLLLCVEMEALQRELSGLGITIPD